MRCDLDDAGEALADLSSIVQHMNQVSKVLKQLGERSTNHGPSVLLYNGITVCDWNTKAHETFEQAMYPTSSLSLPAHYKFRSL